MTHLISFTSSRFDVSNEESNPVNPNAGESVLTWLCEELIRARCEVTKPEPEDWGWYVYVTHGVAKYMVGASSDVDQPTPREWVIQIRRERSLRDKLLGHNKLTEDDGLTATIEGVIRKSGAANDVQVNKNA